jgi:hypothetical protein
MTRLEWRRMARPARWPGMILAVLGGGGLLSIAVLSGPSAMAQTAVTTGSGQAARIAAPAAPAGDSPTGFWYGTDSTAMNVPGPAPYREPAIGGAYGGYVGMTGNWAKWQGCGDKYVWSGTDAADANTDFTRYHRGIGTGAYWFMGGPGVDPHYNGTTGEASAWGEAQAARALADISHASSPVTYPVVFMDVELPGHAPGFSPAADNGWNAVYASPCSGRVKSSYVAAAVDRADFNGFAAYVVSHSSYRVGVYSSPGVWSSIFGGGAAASIPDTYEWTYAGDTSSLARHPSGWCLQGTTICAQYFGGVTSSTKYALLWQWSGGGGTYNGYGDFDQIDGNRTP